MRNQARAAWARPAADGALYMNDCGPSSRTEHPAAGHRFAPEAGDARCRAREGVVVAGALRASARRGPDVY